MHYKEARGILSAQNGMNVFRGCTHGCIYCDSRSRCYQMNHDFEDVEVKRNAPDLLERALRSKKRRCVIGTGAMTDPYLPLERELGITRKCLEIIDRHGFGLAIQTKSNLILRDLALLQSIREKAHCVAQMTLTTYDEALCKILEPGVATTRERVETLSVLRENRIPTVVWLSPLLPFLNDTEENLRGLLDYCRQAGVWGILCYGMGLTLREGNREYFYAALDRHFPGLKQTYHQTYGCRYVITSENSDRLMQIFHTECQKAGIRTDHGEIWSFLRTLPEPMEQLSLF